MFQALIIVKIFVSLFFNSSDRESFATNFVIKHLFTKLDSEIIKIICIIICHYIEKFCHKSRIIVEFEENQIEK